jgi:hypothetical protein
MAQQVRIQLPLLTRLRNLDNEAAIRFPTPRTCSPGLGAAGLILDKRLDRSRYEFCTPVNSRTFARTGGDGTHFSLLILDGRITSKSPVVMTVPPDGMTLVVGESLLDFLCLGCARGFFALQEFLYHVDVAIEAYTNPNWQPSENWHFSVGLGPDDDEMTLLAFLADRLGLHPWTNTGHFHELQDRFGGLLEYPPSDD